MWVAELLEAGDVIHALSSAENLAITFVVTFAAVSKSDADDPMPPPSRLLAPRLVTDTISMSRRVTVFSQVREMQP